MAGLNFYLLTSLAPPGDLGSVPPVSLRELREKVSDQQRAGRLVSAVVLEDDLLQREAFLAGEIERVEPTVLTEAQARNEQPLPDELAPRVSQAPQRLTVDVVWEAYFCHAIALADELGSDFLSAHVRYEVGLRNALASARAKALGLEAAEYLVARELGEPPEGYDAVVAEWSAAANPLAGLRVLDAARWDWLRHHDAYFSFSDDELAAYAAKLVLLHRWHRLTVAQSEAAASSG